MDIAWVFAPAAACLIIAVALGWFGLHVLQRGVIFVDLALAQVAALGTTYAVFLGHEPDEPMAYVLGLLFTVLGAVAFSLLRRFEARVPQEAIIGIAYAASAGAGSMMLDFASDPHGAEKLQHLMVGNIVWVTWTEIGALVAVCVVVGALHFVARRTLLRISFDPEGAEREGVRVPMWDMLFYLTFGLVITTIVHVAGVLLIFSYLIVPAVIAKLFVDGVGRRLLFAYAVSVPVSLLGVSVSYEHAAGPIIVVLLAGCLVLGLVVWGIARSGAPARAAGMVAAGVVALGGLLWAFSTIEVGEHEHGHDEVVVTPVGDLLPADADPAVREGWYRSHLDRVPALVAAVKTEGDPSLRLLVGSALARAGEADGLRVLAELTGSDVPFVRMEADSRLRIAAGEGAPVYDPLAGPDLGVWKAWVAVAPAEWKGRSAGIPTE